MRHRDLEERQGAAEPRIRYERGSALRLFTALLNAAGQEALPMREFPESDWKVFRKLQDGALERFCERVLAEIGRVASDPGKSHHQRYLEICRLLDRRDDELARAFNNPRRSTAFSQLVAIHTYGLVTEEDLSRFTPETQALVQMLAKPSSTPPGPERD